MGRNPDDRLIKADLTLFNVAAARESYSGVNLRISGYGCSAVNGTPTPSPLSGRGCRKNVRARGFGVLEGGG